MKTIKELREERASLCDELKGYWNGCLETAKKENRSPSQEECGRFDRMSDDVDKLKTRIDEIERGNARTAKLDEHAESLDRSAGRRSDPGQPDDGRVPDARGAEDADGRDAPPARTPYGTKPYRSAFRRYMQSGDMGAMSAECRALSVDSSVDGGFLVAPEQFVAELIKFVDDEVWMRRLSRTFPIEKAESMGAPSLDTDISDSDWTAEIATGSEDTAMKFGKRDLHPHPLAKRIKISETLLRKSLIPAEQIVREALGRKFAYTQEQAFLTGTGDQQPLGIFTASANGISTARDMATDNTTTAITADGLINAKFALKSQHAMKARWLFHRDSVRDIRKLKDGEGNYLWVQGISSGQPDTIVEVPYIMSEFVPNTFTAGLYVGIIGNFDHYWIVDALSMTIKRLNELYAETNQVGFIGRLETDGMPVLEEAFTRVTLAT